MKDAWWGVWAMTMVTLREAQRQRLWLLIVAACVGMLLIIPSAEAVDEAARLKLAVAAVAGASGFVVTLLGALLGAAAVRRDIDARVGFVLFSKPLARGAYIGGRWLGVVLGLVVAVCGFILFGTASTWLQLGQLPAPRDVREAEQVWRLENGQALTVPSSQPVIMLGGDPLLGRGEGLRWRFTGLPPAPPEGYEVLIRAQVGGMGQARVTVAAIDEQTDASQALELVGGTDSGQDKWESERLRGRQVFLQDRDRQRNDLAQDYARFALPADAVADGVAVVQLNRLDGDSRVRFDPGGVYLATGGGSFVGNLARAQMVLLAQAALLAAVTICVATVAKIGTALLSGLTIYFGGNALGFIEEGMQWEEFSRTTERLINILLTVLPDFGRFPVAAELAASQQVAWSTVGDAWLYYGAYAGVFLVVAWWSLRKAEL